MRPVGSGVRRRPRPSTSASTQHTPSPMPSPTPPRLPETPSFAWSATTAGLVTAVSDAEILEAQRILAAREGLFCQPESAVTWAGLLRLLREGNLDRNGPAVLVLTGKRAQGTQGPGVTAHPSRGRRS